MEPLRKRLEEARKNTRLPWEIIEKDYILSWVLAGIGVNEKLKNGLILKGGTALKNATLVNTDFQKTLIFQLRKIYQEKMNLRRR